MASGPSADGAIIHTTRRNNLWLFVVGQWMGEEKSRSGMPSDFRILRDLGLAPDIAMELGHMCVAWAALEWRMATLYALIGGAPNAIAREAFYAYHNTSDRAVLVQHTAAMVLRGSAELEAARTELSRVMLSILRAAKRRHDYIHDPWTADLTNPRRTISQLRSSDNEFGSEVARVDRDDISQFTDQIVAWTEYLCDFEGRISSLLVHRSVGLTACDQ